MNVMLTEMKKNYFSRLSSRSFVRQNLKQAFKVWRLFLSTYARALLKLFGRARQTHHGFSERNRFVFLTPQPFIISVPTFIYSAVRRFLCVLEYSAIEQMVHKVEKWVRGKGG